MSFEVGMKVRVLDAANLPCQPGDIGLVVKIRQSARDFPIGVQLGDHVEWFREAELEIIHTDCCPALALKVLGQDDMAAEAAKVCTVEVVSR